MKKSATHKIIILLITVGIIVAGMLWVKYTVNRKEIKQVSNIANAEFNEEHFNYIIVDTFVNLLRNAYGESITSTIEKDKLKVQMTNAGAVTRDFYNGNDKILDLGLSDYGFKIKFDKNENKIDATFVIKNEAVPVPNDVMIKLLDKNFNK